LLVLKTRRPVLENVGNKTNPGQGIRTTSKTSMRVIKGARRKKGVRFSASGPERFGKREKKWGKRPTAEMNIGGNPPTKRRRKWSQLPKSKWEGLFKLDKCVQHRI